MSPDKRTLAPTATATGRLPRLSRTLLLPGPLPPNSHFGVTLLRHVVATGLRSTLHRLGLPLIPAAPVGIIGLRLYLDRDALARELGSAPGASEAIATLVDPAGTSSASPDSARLRGAGLLHRLRLRRLPPLPPAATDHDSPLEEFRATLSALLPALSDAVLAELLSALTRRRDRAAGRKRPPCLGREAWGLRSGRQARLDFLGPPEPLLASWAAAEPPAVPAGDPPHRHLYRGRFREQYRAALDLLTPSYRRVAERATASGLLDDPSDAFFLPLDLADDLTTNHRPDWLEGAIATNRREYITQRTLPSPPDLIEPDSDTDQPFEAWDLCPFNPLP